VHPFFAGALAVRACLSREGRVVATPQNEEQAGFDYEGLLLEMARVTHRRARAVVLTNELRLMQRVLGGLAALWRLDRLTRVEQGGARPCLFVLRRA